MKKQILKVIRLTELGRKIERIIRWILGKEIPIDYKFPKLISIELSSQCNLKCIHCPSHREGDKDEGIRKFGSMSYDVFNNVMNEIDNHGVRTIALHKDGEPLLNKEIISILDRVKKNVNHKVYLSTNGLLLNEEICNAIVRNKIDQINISIGAASDELYKKIRGGDLSKVKKNIDMLLFYIKSSNVGSIVSVQIIDIEDIDMKDEIIQFKKSWEEKEVQIDVWKELTWGNKVSNEKKIKRYPCLALWNSFTINHDGKVSACCMDWNQSLVIGEYGAQSISEIWQSQTIKNYRLSHIKNDFKTMPLCVKCNYWLWHLQLLKYKP